ncbi:MAG: serine hydrolase domain-containing protein [Ilumatobacteraceae bacterium]
MALHRFPGPDWGTGPLPAGTDARAVETLVAALLGSPEELGTTLALLVVHDGRIVLEHYGGGAGPATTLISWSVAKSITHALVGIAVGDGRLSTADRDLFPGWLDDARSRITLQHLLNMSSGLAWNEDYVDGSVSDVIEMLFGSDGKGGRDDHAAFAASKPLVHPPGTAYAYSSGTTNLVTRVLSRALGEVPPSNTVMDAFMRTRLFGPIGMGSAVAKHDRSGNFVGSSFVYATARDFARFGWLYENDGVWDGTRILPAGWVDHGRTWTATDPESGVGYGAHWWLEPRLPGSMAAFGYEGQSVWVVPDRDLVLVRLGKTDAALGPALRTALVDLVRAFPVVRRAGGKSGGDD